MHPRLGQYPLSEAHDTGVEPVLTGYVSSHIVMSKWLAKKDGFEIGSEANQQVGCGVP